MESDTLYKIESYQLPQDEIIKKKLFKVFVFSLPRCGSSMMTHICELLGVNMVHDSEEKKRDYKHLGGEYHPNASGFYEITGNMMKNFLKILNTPYSGCKMIIPVTKYRLELVKMQPSKVIMMWRDPEEIRQSQIAFYRDEQDAGYLKTALVTEKMKLKHQNIDHIIVNYRDVIQNTRKEIQRIKEFIHSDKDIDEAVNFVNPNAYRFNKDHIVEGI